MLGLQSTASMLAPACYFLLNAVPTTSTQLHSTWNCTCYFLLNAVEEDAKVGGNHDHRPCYFLLNAVLSPTSTASATAIYQNTCYFLLNAVSGRLASRLHATCTSLAIFFWMLYLYLFQDLCYWLWLFYLLFSFECCLRGVKLHPIKGRHQELAIFFWMLSNSSITRLIASKTWPMAAIASCYFLLNAVSLTTLASTGQGF